MDETDGGILRQSARLVTNIDNTAILALSEYYAAVFKDGEDVLDTIHVLLGLVTILKIGRGRMF